MRGLIDMAIFLSCPKRHSRGCELDVDATIWCPASLNGTIYRTRSDRFDVTVEDSFGNCDRYIAIRHHSFAREPNAPLNGPREDADHLDERARRMIQRADTLFVASYIDRDDGRRQLDVSRRGGKTGFVDVDTNGDLPIPDFNGNGFFNTLGNI